MKLLSLSFFASIGVTICLAQSSFNKNFTTANGNVSNNICLTSGQGMILTGFSRNTNNKDLLVVRTDNNGDTLWCRSYDSGGSDEGYCVKEASDGSILLGGKKNVTHLDANGNVLWSYQGDFNIHSVRQTQDGRFLFAGDSAGVGLIWTIYQNGATNFAANFHLGNMTFHSIRQTVDGGFIALGTINNVGMVVVKTDGAGNTQWRSVYTIPANQSPGSEQGASIVQMPDSDYIFTGSFIHNTLGGRRLFMGKIDQTGTMQWSKCYGDLNRNITPAQVELAADGGLMIFGSIDTALYDSRAWLMHTDAAGDTLWTREYGAGKNIQLTGGAQPVAGGFALSCRKVNSEESYFIKTDTNALSGCFEDHFPVTVLNVAANTQQVTGNTYVYSSMPYTSNNYSSARGLTEAILCYSVGLKEYRNEKLFSVYPNPATDQFTIALQNETAGWIQVSIFDITGRLIDRIEYDVAIGENKISMERQLPPGSYTLTITGEGFSASRKLVVIRP